MAMRRIAVMTSGGDAPGMNAALRAVVRGALAKGMDVEGIRDGFHGLVEPKIERMTSRSVGGIIRLGGTILQTSRCPEFCTPEGQKTAMDNLAVAGIGGLVVIGGDGSLRGALELHKHGFPVVGVPASIDNDIGGTELSIGTDTALNTILDAVDKIKDTATAHRRAFIVEVMGRRHGYLALIAGIAGGAEMIILPSTPIDHKTIGDKVKEAFDHGKPHYIIIIAEGASMDGKIGRDELYRAVLDAGFEPRVTVLGHVQRGGSPTAVDRILGTRLGYAAIEVLTAGQSGVMIGLEAGRTVAVPLETALATPPVLDEEMMALSGPLAT